MSLDSASTNEDTLTLESKLSEILRIPLWLQSLATRDGISERTQFGMDLCLEEVLSNIIQHGYARTPHRRILVRYGKPQEGTFTLIVEDEAPPFNPLLFPDSAIPHPPGQLSHGGRGIHLLKQFADTLNYEQTPTGNRLTISFVRPESIPQD